MPNPYLSKGMTVKQAAVMNFIQDYFISEQSMPTCQDIADKFEFKSPNASQSHINALRKMGFLEDRRGKTPAYKMAYVKIKIEGVY